jgi:hypothetical protein
MVLSIAHILNTAFAGYLDWQQATEALLPVQGLITLNLTLTQAS